MSEYQKIAIGLLGMTHPEIQQLRLQLSTLAHEDAAREAAAQDQPDVQDQLVAQDQRAAPQKDPASRPGALLRAAKFAFAAFVAGSRAIPLGDNGCVTRQLGAYGARLRV